MKTIDYNSVPEIMQLLEQENLAVQYQFGQNFLINQNARKMIVATLNVQGDDCVWELGPGLGAMTQLLYGNCRSLKLFEIDRGYCSILQRFYPDAIIYEGDCIKTMKKALDESSVDRIIGNLPYNSASAIVLELIRQRIDFKSAVFTVQNEMADRLTAKPGTKDYSSFTVLSQSYFEIKKISVLKGGSFYPKPRVVSAVISLEPIMAADNIRDHQFYFQFVKMLFGNRRKTIRNNFKNVLSAEKSLSLEILDEAFSKNGIDISQRPETLTPKDFTQLANTIAGMMGT